MAKDTEKVQEGVGLQELSEGAALGSGEAKEKFFVKRVKFGQNKDKTKDVFDYLINVQIKRTNPITNETKIAEKRVTMVPEDNSGYDLLDIIYMFNDEAELLIEPYEMTIDKQKISGVRYKVFTTEASTGEVLYCPMKPRDKSDAAVLAFVAR